MSDIPGNPKVSRKLAAILAADIAGYSALMGADEGATVRGLKAQQAVILPMIGEHGGRVIDTAGDGILAEFGSVVNPVECAIAIQKTMTERNAQVEEPRRMQFRIGVNHGDVIYDETRVYGDGVNVAARLESIAAPGGICVSGKGMGCGQPSMGAPAVGRLRDIVAQERQCLRVLLEPQLGQLEEARAEAAEVPRLQPNYTIAGTTRSVMAFKSTKDDKHFFDGLRKAGLPE
jgi:Adenylate and Guanylate cyclase catalytic domain